MNTIEKKPPPKTSPRKNIIKKVKNTYIDIEVYVNILSDVTTHDKSVKGAHTKIKSKGALSGSYFYGFPSYNWEMNGSIKIITKINNPFRMKGTIEIKTTYGPKAKPNMDSGYGRGTTEDDEKHGNTSLGFHEYCHRNDYINYLNTKPLPTFTAHPGITEKKYIELCNGFVNNFNTYFENMEKYSERLTDEVGYKKSTYLVRGARP